MRDGTLNYAIALGLVLPAATAVTACGGEEMFEPQIASTERLIDQSATARFVRDDETVAQLAAVGDLDGDGVDDAVLRTMFARDPAPTNEYFIAAAAYVQYGGSRVKGEIDLSTLPRLDHLDGLNSEVVPVGDVDGDGYADLLVNLPRQVECGRNVPAAEDFGGAYLVYGGPQRLTGTTSVADVGVFIRDTIPCSFVNVVVGLGDLDGDGLDDFAISRTPRTPTEPTQVFLFYGSTQRVAQGAVFDTAASAVITPPTGQAALYTVVARAGDVDHDGHGDFIIDFIVEPNINHLSLIRGSATRLTGTVVAADIAQTRYDFPRGCGTVAAPLGDLDGDGFDDFALESCDYLPPDFHRNLAWRVFYGGPVGFPPRVDPGAEAALIQISDDGTSEIAGADVDGDGVRDLLVTDEAFHGRNGAVHVLKGNRTRLSGTVDPISRATTYIGRTRHIENCDFANSDNCTSAEEVGTGLSLGDITGDHVTDFLICAPATGSISTQGWAGSAPGRVYLVSPSATAK
jgi:hypothetical protein